MKTTPRPPDVETMPVDLTVEVEAFFDALKKAQSVFLGTVGQAHSLLGRESGQLAHVAAIQGRLTRQFFDAQRSIMMRRAEVDVEISRVVSAAEENASAAVAAARVQAAAGVRAERQLTVLLDEWWREEKQEGRAVLDDADARAAVRRHAARIEPGEEVAATRAPGDLARPGEGHGRRAPMLPSEILAALETADPADLQSVLATLADSLAPTPPVAVPPEIRPADDVIIRFDPAPAAPRPSEVAPEEAFRRFWDRPSTPTVAPRSWRWIPARVVLPMTAVTSALALFMALIG